MKTDTRLRSATAIALSLVVSFFLGMQCGGGTEPMGDRSSASKAGFVGAGCLGQSEGLARWADDVVLAGPMSPGRCPGLGEPCPFGAVERFPRDGPADDHGRSTVFDPISTEWLSPSSRANDDDCIELPSYGLAGYVKDVNVRARFPHFSLRWDEGKRVYCADTPPYDPNQYAGRIGLYYSISMDCQNDSPMWESSPLWEQGFLWCGR